MRGRPRANNFEGRFRLPTSFASSDRAKEFLDRIVDYSGTNTSATVEPLVRNHARELGLALGQPGLTQTEQE